MSGFMTWLADKLQPYATKAVPDAPLDEVRLKADQSVLVHGVGVNKKIRGPARIVVVKGSV